MRFHPKDNVFSQHSSHGQIQLRRLHWNIRQNCWNLWIEFIKSISMTRLSIQDTCEWRLFVPVNSLTLIYFIPTPSVITAKMKSFMMTSSNGIIFHVTGHLFGEFTGDRWPVNSPHKGQWRGALMFSLICVWINGWENNREAGDLRRYHAHYNAIAMYLYDVVWIRRNLPASPMLYPIPPKPYIAVTALTWSIHGNDASDVAMAT